MGSRPARRDPDTALRRVPPLELVLILASWALVGVVVLLGLALTRPENWQPTVFTLLGALLFNVILLRMGRRVEYGKAIVWATRLGNLAFLTVGLYLTEGFRSPFFSLYALFMIVDAMRFGWRGATRSFLLFVLSWVVLALLQPPGSAQEWVWVIMLVASFFLLSLALTALAERQVRFWRDAQQREREMVFLRRAGRSLTSSLDPQEVLAETLTRVNELMDVDAASLALVDEISGRLRFELAIGGADEDIVGLEMEPGQGIVGHVIRDGVPLRVSDVSTDPRWHSDVDSQSGYQTRSVLCVPLLVQGRIIGALEALNKRDGPFTSQDQRLLESLADLAAQSIENARLHDRLQRNALRLQEAYNQVQKLDELKSAFIRNVTHELRTPLALISGYLELILDGHMGELRPEQQQSLSLVSEKSALLGHLVNDILSMQTIGSMGYDFQTLSLEPMVREAVNDVVHQGDRVGIHFQLDLPPDGELPTIQGDAKRLRRAVDHLLDNAIKFSPNGGAVSVSLRREYDVLFLRVSDEGIGLDPDQLERVFARFYQVDGSSTRRYGGAGLGLAQVREIIEAHGGSVWAESEGAGKGCKFTLFLPTSDGAAAPQSTA